MDSLRQDFDRSLNAEEEFLNHTLRDYQLDEREVSDVELTQLFPDVLKDDEPLRFAA